MAEAVAPAQQSANGKGETGMRLKEVELLVNKHLLLDLVSPRLVCFATCKNSSINKMLPDLNSTTIKVAISSLSSGPVERQTENVCFFGG